MITTLEEFYRERYQALETELLNAVNERLSREYPTVSGICIEHWKRILKEALGAQEREHIPCAYMSISLLNTSILENKPVLQVDFYNGEWVYGESWARGRMPADFLFREWNDFCVNALDSAFYVRNKLQGIAIQSLFWETAEKLIYIFSCVAKYFSRELDKLPEFQALEKEPSMYVTCGTYLDWQERIHAVLPKLDLTDISDTEETVFRDFHEEKYHNQKFRELNLRHCRFYDCDFRECIFEQVDISDGYFFNCRFRNTEFKGVGMAGCTWEDCDFRSCSFLDSGTHADGDEYFADAEMVRAGFSDTKVSNCDLSYFRLKECREMGVTLEKVKTEHSDWKRYGEVKADG